ncbi:hypothetical protein V1512DRAFT_256838 [Lipomyces arxii]|uniref:uncharacterized protein n=1 Tax=Lipomyces arxii TaxID=56418 RepID=UPI0034D01126
MRRSPTVFRTWTRSLRSILQAEEVARVHDSVKPTQIQLHTEHNEESRQQRDAMDKLAASFSMYMAHSEPAPAPTSKERIKSPATDAVMSHYHTVVSILDDLVTVPEQTNSPYSPSTSRILPTRKWTTLRADLNVCKTSEDYVQLFSYFFTHRRLAPATAKEIIWNSKLQDKNSLRQIERLILNQSLLTSQWSEAVVHSVKNEVWLKLLAIEMHYCVDSTRRTQLSSLILTGFETAWFPIVKQGMFSSRALRTLWYLVIQAESNFDSLGPAINDWGWKVASEHEAYSTLWYTNAVTQMWTMATSLNNKSVMTLARDFFSILAPGQYPPSRKFIFDFVDAVQGSGIIEAKQFAAILRNSKPSDKVDMSVLLCALQIAEKLEASQVQKSGVIKLISDFAMENKILEQSNGTVTDAMLLRRIKRMVEKDSGSNTINSDLTDMLVQVA